MASVLVVEIVMFVIVAFMIVMKLMQRVSIILKKLKFTWIFLRKGELR